MTCSCSPDLDLSSSLLSQALGTVGALVLDEAAELPDDADVNLLRNFLILEALLVLRLTRRNEPARAALATDLRRLVAETDFRVRSAQAEARLLNQVAERIQAYGREIIPAQQAILRERMEDIARRAQSSTLAEIRQRQPPSTMQTFLQTGGGASAAPPVTPPAPPPAQPVVQTPRPTPPAPPRPPGPPAAPPAAQPPRPLPPAPTFRTTQTTSWNQYRTSWTERDTRAMDYLARSQALYAGKYIDTNLVDRARNIVTRNYSLYGDNPARVGTLIQDGLVAMTNVTESYWRTVSVQALANARTYANLATMDENGVQFYVFQAVLDESTTALCRGLHGKSWAVRPQIERMQRAMQATTLADLDAITPLVRNVTNEQREVVGFEFGPKDSPTRFSLESVDLAWLAAQGVCIPPLHFLCRSSIKPA